MLRPIHHTKNSCLHFFNANHYRSVVRKIEKATFPSEGAEEHITKFRDYLLFGHKKEGLEYAMQHGLWGHALFLASKMDDRSYSNVMLRFANGLVVNDPLQTLYQMMSGRQPIAVKECADSSWGDWRPHLAMILSNSKSTKEGLDVRSIKTLGDTLHDKGFLYAGQFCYLMANLDFESYENKNSRLVLIGGDRALPFQAFATNEAIQATEVYEYAQKLSNLEHMIPTLQYYKYMYAIRLNDHGFSNEALHYLEEVSRNILKRPGDIFADYNDAYPVFINNVLKLSEQLKYLDPSYLMRDGEISEMSDPEWLVTFRCYVDDYMNPNLAAHTSKSHTENIGNELPVNNYPRIDSPVKINDQRTVEDQYHYQAYDDNQIDTQPSPYLTGSFNPTTINRDQWENASEQLEPNNLNYSNVPTSADNLAYDHQSSYSPAYDTGLQQTQPDNNENHPPMYQPQPMFINPSSMNFSQSPTMTPETINGLGGASTGGSIQASPVHSVSSTYQDQSSPLLAQEKPQNYFSSGHFSSENNLKETVSIF